MIRNLQMAGIAALMLAFIVGTATAQEKKGAKKMPSQEEMMKRWKEFMTPGQPHKTLESFVGTWDVEAKSWMGGPNSEPSVSKGTSECKMALGGRYLVEEMSTEMMQQPMSGIGYTGYDNFRKKFVGFWIDNMGTGMTTMEGTIDKDGKTITSWGKMDEPATGQKDKKVKYVTHIIDNDKHVFEIYDVTTYGEKQPVLQVTYTRKKS
jgi:hypothetical protein